MVEQHSKKKPVFQTEDKRKTESIRPHRSDDKRSISGADAEADGPLTATAAMEYGKEHNRLLVILLLVAGFLFASFPISDPDIFPSLRVGQMVLAGEFPWGEDPFGYADGEHAPWIHPAWLGDVIIYELYSLGGGPALVLSRAFLMVFVLALLLRVGNPGRTRFLTVFTALAGMLALCPRLYLRTEFFSYICLALTFFALLYPKSTSPGMLRRWTAGRSYWIIPPLFLLWANLDDWFFLGPVVVLIWFLSSFLGNAQVTEGERKALAVVLVLGVLATFGTPFHVKSYAAIPTLLQPPASPDLAVRYAEQLNQNPSQRPPEELRFFLSPWTKDFFNNPRVDVLNSLGLQAPFLPLCYPLGLSVTEWMYYPFTILVLLSIVAIRSSFNLGIFAAVVLFALLGAWQSRLVGFFAVAGMALAIYQWQNRPSVNPDDLGRTRVVFGQLARLCTALVVELLCVAMLIPVPDASPAPLGYVHPRGAFGFSFRVDPSFAQAAERLHAWNSSAGSIGRPFQVDWLNVAQYNPWFNPGGRTFFDRRYEVHSQDVTAGFFETYDALLDSARVLLKPERETPEQRKKRQTVWQKLFTRFDISYIVVRERVISRTQPDGKVLTVSLIFSLLNDRDEKNQPIWQPLDYHDGQVFALAWTGSKHWSNLQPLAFNPGETVFRGKQSPLAVPQTHSDSYSLSGFLLGDPPRRPAAIEEARWYSLWGQRQSQRDLQLFGNALRVELHASMISRLAAQAASPCLQFFLPFLVGETQIVSASSNYLAFLAAQRGVAQLAADAPPRQRADAWEQLLDALTDLIAYEQGLSPASTTFREPLHFHAMRQAAFACEAAVRPRAFELHLQLAALYRSRNVLDTAWEHYQAARAFGENNAEMLSKNLVVKFDSPAQFLEKLPDIIKQRFGGSVTEFENVLKNQQTAWEQEVNRQGWSAKTDATNKFVAQRAELALQSGLVNKALSELLAAKMITPESAAVATSICMQLGQYDIMLDTYLLPFPGLKSILGDLEYHRRCSLGWWCKGMPRDAAAERRIVADLTNTESLRALMVSGVQTIFGTSMQPPGSMINSSVEAQRNAGGSFSVSGHQIAEGMLLLEAGDPQTAAQVFLAALRDVEPQSPWRPLIARYYLQITGRTLETDLAEK